MAHKTQDLRASDKAGPSGSLMSLGLFLCGGSQHFHTDLFNGFVRKSIFPFILFPHTPPPPIVLVKVLELTLIGSGFVMCLPLSQSLLLGNIYTIHIGLSLSHLEPLETSPVPFSTPNTPTTYNENDKDKVTRGKAQMTACCVPVPVLDAKKTCSGGPKLSYL